MSCPPVPLTVHLPLVPKLPSDRFSQVITRGAKTLKICTLLDKPVRRSPKSTITVDYCGFTIPNEFVVGYGLDYAERYRNLPFVGVLKPEIYS